MNTTKTTDQAVTGKLSQTTFTAEEIKAAAEKLLTNQPAAAEALARICFADGKRVGIRALLQELGLA